MEGGGGYNAATGLNSRDITILSYDWCFFIKQTRTNKNTHTLVLGNLSLYLYE